MSKDLSTKRKDMGICLKAYITAQTKEVLEHKYFLSQKKGEDIGEENASRDWISSGHAERFEKAYLDNMDKINDQCLEKCKGFKNCKGIEKCPLSLVEVHQLLKD